MNKSNTTFMPEQIDTDAATIILTNKPVYHFFWWCSGSTPLVIASNPTEHNKYASIGMAVFLTAIAALISGSYAAYQTTRTIENAELAIPLALSMGLIWALFIFNTDRFIVLSIDSRASLGERLLAAAPRLILAMLLGVAVSKPLALQIFAPEISTQLKKDIDKEANTEWDSYFSNQTNLHTKRISDLESAISAAGKKTEDARREMRAELNGEISSSGLTSGKPGPGRSYKDSKRHYTEQKKVYDALINTNAPEIAKSKLFIDTLGEKRDAFVSDFKITRASDSGLLDRINSHSNLKEGHSAIFWADMLLMMIFIVLEISPVIIKLLSKPGLYENSIEHIEVLHREMLASKKGQFQARLEGIEEAMAHIKTEFSSHVRQHSSAQFNHMKKEFGDAAHAFISEMARHIPDSGHASTLGNEFRNKLADMAKHLFVSVPHNNATSEPDATQQNARHEETTKPVHTGEDATPDTASLMDKLFNKANTIILGVATLSTALISISNIFPGLQWIVAMMVAIAMIQIIRRHWGYSQKYETSTAAG